MVHVLSIKRRYPRRTEKVSFSEAIKCTRDATVALVMPLIIIGGIVGGVFTPTEAAAVAVTYALMVGALIFRNTEAPGHHWIHIRFGSQFWKALLYHCLCGDPVMGLCHGRRAPTGGESLPGHSGSSLARAARHQFLSPFHGNVARSNGQYLSLCAHLRSSCQRHRGQPPPFFHGLSPERQSWEYHASSGDCPVCHIRAEPRKGI